MGAKYRHGVPKKRHGVRNTLIVVLACLCGVAGYGTADAFDVVPGVLTLAPLDPAPDPYALPADAKTIAEVPEVLAAPDPAAPVPDPQTLAGILTPLLADERFGPELSLQVLDAVSGETLFDRDAAVPRTPASTLKILTSAAALMVLGPDYAVATEVKKVPGQSIIVLKGNGDMMLAADTGDPMSTNGRAGLGDLAAATAQALRDEGIESVELQLDDTFFTGPNVAPTVDPADVAKGFLAPLASLAIDIARLDSTKEYSPRSSAGAVDAATVFSERLAQHGITVTTPTVATTAATPQDLDVIATVKSAPLRDLVAYALVKSDNTITEVIGRLAAQGAGLDPSVESAAATVIAQIGELGIDVTGMVVADCSGLAAGSLVASATLNAVLHQAYTGTAPALRALIAGLPIAGLNGTMSTRLAESSSTGFVRAKTGSLTSVSSLSGIVTDVDGRDLVFTIISNAGPAYSGATRPAVDVVVKALRGCGCQPA